MSYAEELEGVEVVPVMEPGKNTAAVYGAMEVYRRIGWRKWHLPKYVVFQNSLAVEDFRTRSEAIKWAKAQVG